MKKQNLIRKEDIKEGLVTGLVIWLVTGLVYGLVAGLVYGLVTQIIALIMSNPAFSMLDMVGQIFLILLIQGVGWYYVYRLGEKWKHNL